VTEPVWRLEGPLGEDGRRTTRFFRAPDRERAAAAFGLKVEDVRIKRLRPGEKVGPQGTRRR
jgi:hypothetical protein